MKTKAIKKKTAKTKIDRAAAGDAAGNVTGNAAGNAAVRTRGIDHKTWIMVCFAVIALVFVVVAILNFTPRESYDSSYFHDTEDRIVLTMGRDAAALEDSQYEPNITHIVYYYEGDKVTGVKAFYEYATEKEAETAFTNLTLGNFADSKYRSGRFVIFQVKKANYEGLTVEALRADIEQLKSIDALILDYTDGYINKYAALEF